MSIKVNDAISAYQKANQPGLGQSSSSPLGKDFSSYLKDSASDAIETMQHAENMAARGMIGQADQIDVVTAISEAEMVLQTVTSVRDQIVNALREVFSMPI